jgi:D-cysteine desulfhydrase family pyridoxal phosphate-dependent enzyme
MKRDDLNGLGLGGNKLRKLEYAMAEAQEQGAGAVITTGAVQSNHCRLVTAAANRLGLKTYLVLRGEEPELATGNLLVDKILGAAEIHYVPNTGAYGDAKEGGSPVERTVRELEERLRSEGEIPYYIPNGCRPLHGALGYAGCVREVIDQLFWRNLAPDCFITACGSTSTQVGLILGSELYCQGMAKVVGISISGPREKLVEKIGQALAEAHAFLGLLREVTQDIEVYDDYIGEGYGLPTPAMREAVKLLARKEGIILDPVYTGKAMAGLLDLIQKGLFRQGDVVVFIHTGGIPGLFASEQLATFQM